MKSPQKSAAEAEASTLKPPRAGVCLVVLGPPRGTPPQRSKWSRLAAVLGAGRLALKDGSQPRPMGFWNPDPLSSWELRPRSVSPDPSPPQPPNTAAPPKLPGPQTLTLPGRGVSAGEQLPFLAHPEDWLPKEKPRTRLLLTEPVWQ